MAIKIGQSWSRFVAFFAVFTALVAVFDAIPIIPGFSSGVWDSWIFLLSPLLGVLLGPFIGGLSVGIGSLLGHFILPRDPFEFLFMLGAPVGAIMAGFVYQRRWQLAVLIYSIFLAGYFLTPISWVLPLVGIWDVLVGYILLLGVSGALAVGWWPTTQRHAQLLQLILSAIIGLETDILIRIFILVPGQTYWLFYGWDITQLQLLWLSAGIITPLKVALAALTTSTIGFSLIQLLPRLGIHSTPES